eukprot:s3881_g3.t3
MRHNARLTHLLKRVPRCSFLADDVERVVVVCSDHSKNLLSTAEFSPLLGTMEVIAGNVEKLLNGQVAMDRCLDTFSAEQRFHGERLDPIERKLTDVKELLPCLMRKPQDVPEELQQKEAEADQKPEPEPEQPEPEPEEHFTESKAESAFESRSASACEVTRLLHSKPRDIPVATYDTVTHEDGTFQATLQIGGRAHAVAGLTNMDYRGHRCSTKKEAEVSAAKAFWDDPRVLEKAKSLEPSKRARNQKKRCAQHNAKRKAQYPDAPWAIAKRSQSPEAAREQMTHTAWCLASCSCRRSTSL